MMEENNYTGFTVEELEKAILEKSHLMVEFKARWSGISHITNPIMKEIAKAYKGDLDIYSIDIDNNTEISKKYGVNKLPTLVFFDRGKPIDAIVGARSKIEIIKRIESLYN